MKHELFGLPIVVDAWEKRSSLPLYIADTYSFHTATIGSARCTIIAPASNLPTLPALKKHLQKIRGVENVPVVLKLQYLSYQNKQQLIKNNIAFITPKQAFLPFVGAMLCNEETTRVACTRFYYSTQQLFLLYLYNNKKEFYVKDALKTLTFSTMTLSRAVKQLIESGLFTLSKDGVSNVITAQASRATLFKNAQPFLLSPVRTSGYISKSKATSNMVLAGESLLANLTMVNHPKIATLAAYEKNVDKNVFESKTDELIDPDSCVRLELWAYNPTQLSDNDCADALSVALSCKNTQNERIEQAVNSIISERLHDND